jgi:isoquinoline 1-oxidoreductase beta subunit
MRGSIRSKRQMVTRLTSLTRRNFFKGTGALVVSVAASASTGAADPVRSRLNAWVAVGPGETVTLALAHAEMGQGITTTMPALIADELGVDLGKVRLEAADFDPAFRNPTYQWMFTGNSESIATYADIVRRAGAAARIMLIEAAADRLHAPAAELAAEDGHVVHRASGRRLSFGRLAPAAARLTPPKDPSLRAARPNSRSRPRLDIPAKVDGSAVFGIDVKVPGMLYAAVKRAPSIGGELADFDERAALTRPGVVRCLRLQGGLAVVADRWWRAQSALAAAKPSWRPGPFAGLDTEAMLAPYRDGLAGQGLRNVKAVGDAPATLAAGSGPRLAALYRSPFQAHATMEPMNCTAHVTADRCELWVPTQGTEMAHLVAKQVTGLADAAIHIHRTLLGGGFGRRLLGDFVKQAVMIAGAVGKPVKLIWSREEDFAQDSYRSAILHQIEARLGGDGMPIAVAHRLVAPSMLLYAWARGTFPDLADATQPADPPEAYDLMPVEGLIEPLYGIPNYGVDFLRLKTPLPVSVWRTTGHGPNSFAWESFIDELAHAAGVDPVAYRRRLLAGNARALRVLDALAERARLDRPPPKGQARGVAIAAGFGSVIAQAVTLAVAGKEIKLHKVVSVADPGQVLDPAIATRNIEGGVVWGLSALRTEMTFADGAAAVTNFDAFDPLHLWETPAIETHFLDSGEKLGGVGELGPVPTLAAVCNAVFAATGDRIRTLPLGRSGYSIV